MIEMILFYKHICFKCVYIFALHVYGGGVGKRGEGMKGRADICLDVCLTVFVCEHTCDDKRMLYGHFSGDIIYVQ